MAEINPYGTSTTILEAAGFFGRNEELDYLFGEISARRCISIIGVRRIGKSSLLRALCLPEMQARFASSYDLQKFLLIYIDLGEFLSKTTDDFFAAVCQQLLIQAKGRLTLEIAPEDSGGDRFCQLLEQIQEQGFYTILLFDAFHKITQNIHFDAKFFSFMRSQANSGRVSYVTASITTLDKCSHPYIEDSPFFNIFNVYRLGPLDEEDARALIATPARLTAHPFSDEDIDEVRLLAGRHPFFIQRVCFLIFKRKAQLHKETTKLRYEAFHDLLPHFKDIWEASLDAEQREYLREEVRWKHVKQKKYPELGESLLFRRFVRDTFNIDMIDITVEDMDEILRNLNNTKFLSECRLTHFSLFFTRAQHAGPLSLNERAAIVRKILQEARDRLRPLGKQSDTAAEWQFFNILNNRYFVDHLKNEVLAQLLGISIRQLQRERNLAVEALRDILSDMEISAREALD